MILTVYIITLIYFVIGACLTFYINRKKNSDLKKKSWTKFVVYFLIINTIMLGTIIHELIFQILSFLIIFIGLYELIKVFYLNKSKQKTLFFIFSLFVYVFVSVGFVSFAFLRKEIIIYTFFLVMVLDASSQLSGQLFGKRKIFRKTSPNKTLGGAIGGIIITFLTSLFIQDLIGVKLLESMILGFSISIIAILGDFLASFYKRKFQVKDFSNLLPENGGILDRFDSFLLVAAYVSIYAIITQL